MMTTSQNPTLERHHEGSAAALPAPTPKLIHRALCEMPYTHYVVGSYRDGEANGMVADWVMQVSFDPRRIAVAFENDAYTLESIRRGKFFTLNVLTTDSMDLAARLLQPRDGGKIGGRSRDARRRIHHKLDGVGYRSATNDCPVLDDAVMWLECEALDFIDVGDHQRVIADVRNGAVEGSGEPLSAAFTGWEYGG